MDLSPIKATPSYRHKGHVYQFGELANELSDDELDVVGLSDETEEYDLPFLEAMEESGAAIPERIIISYDPEAGTMESSWDYEGTKDHPEDTGGEGPAPLIRARTSMLDGEHGSPGHRAERRATALDRRT